MQPQDRNEGQNYDNERKIYEAFHVPPMPRSSFCRLDTIEKKYDVIRVPTQLTKEDFWKFFHNGIGFSEGKMDRYRQLYCKAYDKKVRSVLYRMQELTEKIYSQNQDSSAQVRSKLTKRGRLNCH